MSDEKGSATNGRTFQEAVAACCPEQVTPLRPPALPSFSALDFGALGRAYWTVECTGVSILDIIPGSALVALFHVDAFDGVLNFYSDNRRRLPREWMPLLEVLPITEQGKN